MSGMTPRVSGPREGLDVYAALTCISTSIAVGILGLDADAIAATLTLFFYIGSLDMAVEGLCIGIVHIFPVSEVIIVCVHSNIGRACGSTLPAPYAQCEKIAYRMRACTHARILGYFMVGMRGLQCVFHDVTYRPVNRPLSSLIARLMRILCLMMLSLVAEASLPPTL